MTGFLPRAWSYRSLIFVCRPPKDSRRQCRALVNIACSEPDTEEAALTSVMKSSRGRKIHPKNADMGSRQQDCSPEARSERAILTEALTELHKLLQDYAPSWYSEEHDEKITSALKLMTRR